MAQVICPKHDEQGALLVCNHSSEDIRKGKGGNVDDWIYLQVVVDGLFYDPWILLHKKHIGDFRQWYSDDEIHAVANIECSACVESYFGKRLGHDLQFHKIPLSNASKNENLLEEVLIKMLGRETYYAHKVDPEDLTE